MTTASSTAGSDLARWLLSLTVVLALFAMHGPSSDHTLATPMQGSMPMSMPMSMSMSMSMPMVSQAHRNGLAETVPAAAVSSTQRRACVMNDLGAGGMFHTDCVATLRANAARTPSSFVGGAPAVIRPDPARTAALVAERRGPPRPSLDRLCISRR